MSIPLKESLEIGNFDLISKDQIKKLENRDITGDCTVLANPIFDEAFQNVLKKFKPSHKVAFLSLCTYSRPYNTSPKWKKYLEDIENVDFFVTSNGGFIPQKYWNESLYLSYHAPATKSWAEKFSRDEAIKSGFISEKDLDPERFEGHPPILTINETNNLYKNKLFDRILTFFRTFRYDYVFGDFVKSQRNFDPFISAMNILKSEGSIKDFDYPREDIPYEENGRNYPTLSEPYYNEMIEKINKIKEKI